jgi:hypothetical protein
MTPEIVGCRVDADLAAIAEIADERSVWQQDRC